MTVIPVNKITIEEIKEMIEEKKAIMNARAEKLLKIRCLLKECINTVLKINSVLDIMKSGA